jgi:hypothetical protein
MSSEREDHHCEVAATENSLLADNNSHSVCGMLASAEATRRNVPILTRRQADGPQESTVVALYQKASIEGISLSARPTARRSAVAKKAKALAASTRRRSR